VEVRKHRPEAGDRGRGDRHAELGEVPLDEGANEVTPPTQALAVVGGEKRTRETAPEPKRVEGPCAHLVEREGAEVVERDAAGE
jgi:hypothetical protein